MNRRRTLRSRLKNGDIIFGLFYKMNSPVATELIGLAGFDFIVIDGEHSPMGYESMENMVRCSENVGLETVIRVPCASEEHIFHALDSGASGVQIPNMTSVKEFEDSVKSAKYYPEGCRGLSKQTRACKYGLWNTETDGNYTQVANENSLVVVHIENKEMAVEAGKICEIPQIDVLFIGPADMSQSMGVPGKTDNPRVVETAMRVIQTANEYGKVAGINVTNEAEMKQYIEAGARYIMYNSDTAAFIKGLKSTASQFEQYR